MYSGVLACPYAYIRNVYIYAVSHPVGANCSRRWFVYLLARKARQLCCIPCLKSSKGDVLHHDAHHHESTSNTPSYLLLYGVVESYD